MKNPELKSLISEISPIKNQTWNDLALISELNSIQKMELLVKKDQSFTYEVFLIDGLLRCFDIDEKGNELTIGFYSERSFVAPYFMRNVNTKATYNIQAVQNCKVVLFNEPDFTKLRNKYQDLNELAHKVVHSEVCLRSYKDVLLSKRNLADKYLYFKEKFKVIEKEIAQVHIASYIGSDPVSLSRIKRKLLKEQS